MRASSYEQKILERANSLLSNLSYSERLQALEAVSCFHTGADPISFWNKTGQKTSKSNCFISLSEKIAKEISKTKIPFPLAVSALGRPPLSVEEQKKNGVFYTDFRLAGLMADDCRESLKEKSSVADLACGSGILLAAVAMAYKDKYPISFNAWISKNLFAFDLSKQALVASRAALLSMTNDLDAVVLMFSNWKAQDTLLTRDNRKYDIVIGNPPWGKIKLTEHSFNQSRGVALSYGSDQVADEEKDEFKQEKALVNNYARQLRDKYSLLGSGDTDMYMAFLQKAISSVSSSGHLCYLVPSGIIHSKGTLSLRKYLLQETRNISFGLLDNKPRFFTIDSRFKVILLSADKRMSSQKESLRFALQKIDGTGVRLTKRDKIDFDVLALMKVRPDLTIPEFTSLKEKEIFFKILNNGISFGVGLWKANIQREVDMTNDSGDFVKKKSTASFPVIEGRMVQQFRFGAKAFVSGSGRSATWVPSVGEVCPQFYVPKKALSESLLSRIGFERAGYCDIAGQTNERAMMSALIPAGVVCGNKVPTLLFEGEDGPDKLALWVGITNSFVFDWMIRRIITTTVNYFLLFSIPMPRISIRSSAAQEIISLTRQLSNMDGDFYSSPEMGLKRATIDADVALAYGLTIEDLVVIMKDFPLLDRKQPVIEGDEMPRSTITRDLFLSAFVEKSGNGPTIYKRRLLDCQKEGGLAYVPTEMVGLERRGKVR